VIKSHLLYQLSYEGGNWGWAGAIHKRIRLGRFHKSTNRITA
jgi:hypothetical protein